MSFNTLRSTTVISLAALVSTLTAWPALATTGSYFETRDLVSYSGIGNNPGDTVVQFGGCENEGTCYDTADDNYHNSMWVIGDLGVKQGVYYLPQVDSNDHGKLRLQYDYKLTSEETSTDSADYGRIRIKDVDTDTVIYEQVLLPDNASSDWQTATTRLPGSYATKNLQLVFESNNDDSGLTKLYIRNWSLKHKSEPAITGTITYQVDGETRYAANALVALQNKARTTTIAYVNTNDQGEYTFFPVKAKRRYVVAATLGTYYNGLGKTHAVVEYGNEYTVSFKLK